MKDEEGNLTIETSLIMPIIVLYILLVIGASIFVYNSKYQNIKTNREKIEDYEPIFETNKTFFKI